MRAVTINNSIHLNHGLQAFEENIIAFFSNKLQIISNTYAMQVIDATMHR